MKYLADLFARNQAWAAGRIGADPDFFSRLAHIQRPDLLWIGCSDSRVPANEIVGLAPGELFVHRNVANLVPATDVNALAVIEYAVSSLAVRHIIVCGHYHCGGVRAALEGHQAGAVALWLQPLRNLADVHRDELDALPSDDARWDRLCELNVAAQVQAVAQSEIVETAWERGAELAVHGWIYDLEDGLLRDLGVTVGAAGAGSASAEASALAAHDPRRGSTGGEWTEEAREEALARAPEFGRRFFDETFARFPAAAGATTFLRWSTQPDDVYAVVDLPDHGFTVQIDPALEYVIVWAATTHAEFGDWCGDQVEPALALVTEIVGDDAGAARQEA